MTHNRVYNFIGLIVLMGTSSVFSKDLARRPAQSASSLEICIDDIREGFEFYSNSKTQVDRLAEGRRSKIRNFSPSSLTDSIRSQDEMRNVYAAYLLIDGFHEKLKEADGELYRSEAQKACSLSKVASPNIGARENVASFEIKLNNFLYLDSAKSTISTLQINLKWVMLKLPSQEEFDRSKKYIAFDQVGESSDKSFKSSFGFTLREWNALFSLKNDGYMKINPILYGSNGVAKRWASAYTDTINYALTRLPNYQGLVMRGVDLPESVLKAHKVGDIVTYEAFTSTAVGKEFPGLQKLTIRSLTGKYIEDFFKTNESEVLFRTGARFKILKRNDERIRRLGVTRTAIEMEEVP